MVAVVLQGPHECDALRDAELLQWGFDVCLDFGELPTELTMTNFKTDDHEWYSPPFYTSLRGYKMCFSVYASGLSEGKGTHVSVFAHLMRGEFDDNLKWPFRGDVTIAMLNQLEPQELFHLQKTLKSLVE